MNIQTNAILRLLRNFIRTGIVTDIDLDEGMCRVQTGGMETTWLNWFSSCAGRSRVWWAPSIGEQVLLLAIGDELDTAFVLPGIFSDDNSEPSASPDALHVSFPYGAHTVSGIKTADVTASGSIMATVSVVLNNEPGEALASVSMKSESRKVERRENVNYDDHKVSPKGNHDNEHWINYRRARTFLYLPVNIACW